MPRQKSHHVDSATALAERLREARERVGLSQRQLALGICTPAYVSRLEKGERIPSLQLLRQLAERLSVDADELAGGLPARAVDPLLDAELALRLDEVDEAERLFEAALPGGAPRDRARATAGLGKIAFRRGDHRRAIELLEASRTDRAGGVAVADTVGRAYATVGDLGAAISIFEEALAEAEGRGDAPETLRFEVLLANAFIDSGGYDQAARVLERALTLTEGWADPVVRARLWWSQSRLHEAQGEPHVAARYARLALETLDATEQTVYAARAHQLLAHIELDRGNARDALELLERGLPLVAGSGNRFEHATFTLERARALAQLDQRDEAAATAMEAAALLRESSPGDAGRAYMLIGEVFEGLGELERAQELYELAVEQMPSANHHRGAAYARLAAVLEARGKTDEALALLKRAVGDDARTHRA